MANPFACPHWAESTWWDYTFDYFKASPPDWDDIMALILTITSSTYVVESNTDVLLAVAAEMRAMEAQRSKSFIALRKEMREGSPTTGVEGSETPGQRTPPQELESEVDKADQSL